jgi:hypothetical protein
MLSEQLRFGHPDRTYRQPATTQQRRQLVRRKGGDAVRTVVTRGYLERMERKQRKKDLEGIDVKSLKTRTLPSSLKQHYEDPSVQGLLFFKARENARAADALLGEELYT